MDKKRASGKSSGINDFLDQRETRKYGPRIISNEAQYSEGEMSKALRAKMAADRMAGRTVESGTRSMLDGMKSFMRSSAKTAFKGVGRGGGGRHGTRL